MFECAICLQTLLKPVTAPCGHIFCLPCAEQLATNHYACGVCKSHKPSLDLASDKKCETIIRAHLEASPLDERTQYAQRETDFN